MTEEWLDFSLEIHAIHGVDLGRYLERDAEPLGERDGQIGTLLGRDAPEKREIVASARRVGVLVERKAMIDRARPVHAQPLEGMALSMADGHEGLISEMLEDRKGVGQVESPVECVYRRRAGEPSEGKGEMAHVAMDNVEVPRVLEHPGQFEDMEREVIPRLTVEP